MVKERVLEDNSYSPHDGDSKAREGWMETRDRERKKED